jgi:probable HAF family extracellular repeat protein
MRGIRQSSVRLSFKASVLLLLTTAGWSQSLTWLGTLWGGVGSKALGISADGSVVVGWAYNAAWQDRAFRWTAAGGMQDLSTTYASRKEDQGR